MKTLVRNVLLVTLLLCFRAGAATDNSGNSPAFIMIDLCSNGIGDASGNYDATRMQPDVFDIGLDIDADGTIDRWLSQEGATWFGGGNSEQITPDGWRRMSFFQLSQYADRKMRLRIVDKSPDYYMAINAIRVNGADGKVVTNAIPNGLFEASNPLQDWTVIEPPSRIPPSSSSATPRAQW